MRCLLLAVMLAAIPSLAALVEEKRWVPASGKDSWGHEVSRDIMVTLFYDGSVDGPRPVVIINHGRAVTAADVGSPGTELEFAL